MIHPGVRPRARPSRVVLLLAGLLLAASVGALADYEYTGSCTSPHDEVTLDDHVVRFCGRTYDAGADESTWYYSVTSGYSPELSHWILALCVEHTVVDAGPGTIELGKDKTTQITGIKWDNGMSGGETRLHWFTLSGNWEVEEVEVGVKAGGNTPIGLILGPSCTPYTPPVLEVTVSGLTDLTITQTLIGIWASNPAQLRQSLGDLSVSVVATVNYETHIWYSVSPAPSPAFDSDPLEFEYPTGTFTTLPSWPTMAPLPGLNGTDSELYPITVDLVRLGNRSAGESFTFTVHVLVSEVLGP